MQRTLTTNKRAKEPLSETLDESFKDVPEDKPYKEFQATLGSK